MLNKQNLHVHSNYADGKNSLEELIVEAIDKGFDSIGFSEHSYMPFSSYPYQMNVEGTEVYKKEVASLKLKYKDKIGVYCGMEFEYYSDIDTSAGVPTLQENWEHCLSIVSEAASIPLFNLILLF